MSLAEQQSRLLAALASGGQVPPGFSREHLGLASRVLAHKRAHTAARAWPDVAPWMATHFEAYARDVPPPHHGGPLADARFFVQWLEARGATSAELQRQALAIDLRHARRGHGLVPRRGPYVRLVRLRGGAGYCIGLRLWGAGTTLLTWMR
nr:hypothetical protein [uncultured Caldimonas sp.]